MPAINYDADIYDDIRTALENTINTLRNHPAKSGSEPQLARIKALESTLSDLRENGRGYEGWSNWETWNTRMLIMNDPRYYNTAMVIGEHAYRAIDAGNIFATEGHVSSLRATFFHLWKDCVNFGRASWGAEYKPQLCNWLELLESFTTAWKENDDYTREVESSRAVS